MNVTRRSANAAIDSNLLRPRRGVLVTPLVVVLAEEWRATYVLDAEPQDRRR